MKHTYPVILVLALVLSACSQTAEKPGAAVEDRSKSSTQPAGDVTSGGATSYGTSGEDAGAFSALDDPQSPLSTRVIYFAYDSSEIGADFRDIIAAHGRYLAANPKQVMSLEGHADERGSREYNLALGERRAQAVKRQMLLLGATSPQIRTVSYGEERPAADGHDEYAWSQNRRVEIIY